MEIDDEAKWKTIHTIYNEDRDLVAIVNAIEIPPMRRYSIKLSSVRGGGKFVGFIPCRTRTSGGVVSVLWRADDIADLYEEAEKWVESQAQQDEKERRELLDLRASR
jgi:hypothetical protein